MVSPTSQVPDKLRDPSFGRRQAVLMVKMEQRAWGSSWRELS